MSTCIMIKLLQTEKKPRDDNELAREIVHYYLEHQNEPWFFFYQNKKQKNKSSTTASNHLPTESSGNNINNVD